MEPAPQEQAASRRDVSGTRWRWTARGAVVLLALLLSLFALDVFDENQKLGPTLLAFVVHLAPSLALILLLVISWRHERLGVLLFGGLALVLLATSSGQAWFLSVLLLLVSGALWRARKERTAKDRR